eukprot:CAMPEP_0170942394 /NCGR_PEP_ID=MMETSP0735-20130129/24164_1 /TAXON_ID=186038 /ORGANISM="Fragilariopsis kerguelensis, Strain L26-C5" /LENGTH=35 /DNA_ID= /DNA_START= /DNA_END= /DNA_ORIENTATION=
MLSLFDLVDVHVYISRSYSNNRQSEHNNGWDGIND